MIKPGYYMTKDNLIARVKEVDEEFAYGYCNGLKMRWRLDGSCIGYDFNIIKEYTVIKPGTYRTVSGQAATIKYFKTIDNLWHGDIDGVNHCWDTNGKSTFSNHNLVLSMTLDEAIKALKEGKRVQHYDAEVRLDVGVLRYKSSNAPIIMSTNLLTGWSLVDDCVTIPVEDMDGILKFNYYGEDYVITHALNLASFKCYIYDKGPEGVSPRVSCAKTIGVRLSC